MVLMYLLIFSTCICILICICTLISVLMWTVWYRIAISYLSLDPIHGKENKKVGQVRIFFSKLLFEPLMTTITFELWNAKAYLYRTKFISRKESTNYISVLVSPYPLPTQFEWEKATQGFSISGYGIDLNDREVKKIKDDNQSLSSLHCSNKNNSKLLRLKQSLLKKIISAFIMCRKSVRFIAIFYIWLDFIN
jgi:hypothetical protein